MKLANLSKFCSWGNGVRSSSLSRIYVMESPDMLQLHPRKSVGQIVLGFRV